MNKGLIIPVIFALLYVVFAVDKTNNLVSEFDPCCTSPGRAAFTPRALISCRCCSMASPNNTVRNCAPVLSTGNLPKTCEGTRVMDPPTARN
ncbi:unnamed protein product [Allacma fusca]|uniref:Uncharacterized protein n=1 Tax=Allacma fusca TaxID=39272 RepID=A0A8J2KM23_9HEXA|nr:unnamed protein product [Allacma fusca]